MFVTIVGIGTGNILMNFASVLSQFRPMARHRLSMVWLLMMLLSFLNMFWNVLALAAREDWAYAEFLYVITGPILLVFAANLLGTHIESDPDDASARAASDQRVMTRFFWFFAAVQAWFVGMDFVLQEGWGKSTMAATILAALAVTLALVKSTAVRAGVSVLLLLLVIGDIALRSVA